MSDRNIRHVEDVFGERSSGVNLNKSQNILDRKSSFNMFKNKQAPRPPTGQPSLPKIGNYQPKILLEKTPGDTEPLLNKHEVKAQIHNNPVPTPLIMGDKDVPLRIENDMDDLEDVHPEPPPRRKRRAPSVPGREVESSEPVTGNPIFGRSVSQRSDEERFEMDLEEQGGDIDFGHGLDNPGFNSRERKISAFSGDSESDASWVEEQHQRIQREHQNSKKGITYPYIPPPDYEDEEITMDFEDDYEPVADYNRNIPRSMYKELEGDDFGKYMQEDDYEFDAPNRLPRRAPPGGHGGPFMQNRARPHQRPTKSNKHIDKKVAKSKKKHAPDPDMKRNTIRDFAFSDSKIGWGDKTVKSTSAKGRYIKHNKDRARIDKSETFGKEGPGTYEEFLRVKNGIPLESPNSSDSGVDTGEERHHRHMYAHSQPKQMRNGKYDHKPSMWQRLTWRFRKTPNVYRPESERL